MKKKLIYPIVIGLFGFITFSCNDESVSNAETPTDSGTLLKYPQSDILVDIDYINDPKDLSKQSPLIFLKDSIWTNNQGHSYIYENDEISVSSSLGRYIYPGSLLQGGSIETMKYTPISNRVEPITVSFSFPADYVIAEIPVPTLSSVRQAVRKALKDNGMAGKQIASIKYEISQYSHYNEVKLSFNSNVDVAGILNITTDVASQKVRATSALLAKYEQINFTVDMDLPLDGNLLLNNNELANIGKYSPTYVSSVAYGRSAVISIESETRFDSLRWAVNVVLNLKPVGGSINVDSRAKSILEKSKITLYKVAENTDGIGATVKGLDGFLSFIAEGNQFDSDHPGVPIKFTSSYLVDNSPFYTRFKVDMSNK